MTKIERVFNYMNQGNTITQKEATELFGATRLADIIFRLKARGVFISDKRLSENDRFGDKCNFKMYWIKNV